MLKKKVIRYIIIGVVLFLIFFFILGFLGKNNNGGRLVIDYPEVSKNALYDERIFDSEHMHEVSVTIAKDDWKDLVANPLDKTNYKVKISIDGETFENVAFRTKGNSSLKNITEGPSGGPASTRFSYQVDFDKYDKKQTYFGLDTLNLNNVFGDATYLNDHISYYLFRKMGVPAPLDSYVYLKINNRPIGIYSAVEEVSESFLKRNNLDGNLYKPEQTNGKNYGASLAYRGDKTTNYSDIFSNSKTDITMDDEVRLINSLKLLNSNHKIDSAVNVDEVIRYFAVHNFLLSYDSYTGKSIHNYYLLEKDGKMTMLPWDYNLSFGRFNMLTGLDENAKYFDINTIVNYGIDSPVCMSTNEDRPMWNWILKNDIYLEKYHQAMNELVTNYLETGEVDKLIDSQYEMLSPYLRYDYSAFYTPDQVKTGVDNLKAFCDNRTKSIRLQLDGKLAKISSNQDKSSQVDSSSIDLNTMGLVADDSKRPDTN